MPFPVWLGLLALFALALRLWGIDARSISHPEIFVPGIPLPAGISAPPLRQDIAFTLWWHFHVEPHPIGWYLAMFGWTELFGTSQTVIRLPSALFGAGAVMLIGLLGRRVYSPFVGFAAAMMLALHGFHIFWSQAARMYTPGVFIGILSVLLLFELIASDRRRPWLELGYVLTVVAGIQTVELFWPLLLLQMLWVVLVMEKPKKGIWTGRLGLGFAGTPRAMQIQAIALMMSAPALAHSFYRARGGAASEPNMNFIQEYLGFGFLFPRDVDAIPVLQVAPWIAASVALFAVLLVGVGLAAGTRRNATRGGAKGDIHPALPIVVALLCTGLMLWFSAIAHRRNAQLAVVAMLPILALAVPFAARAARTALSGLVPRFDDRSGSRHPGEALLWLLALVAPAVLFLASLKMSVLAPRAFLIFVPYLLILTAAGIEVISRRPAIGATLGLVLLFLFAASIPYSWNKPGSPRDYQSLAVDIKTRLAPGDLVFVRKAHWVDTPFFYYINDANFVAEDWADALRMYPVARVWLVTWPDRDGRQVDDERRESLTGYRRVAVFDHMRARAELFVRGAQ